MGKQSSVEWLIENYKQLHFDFQEGKINQSQFLPKKINIEEQAKSMHKDEIEVAYSESFRLRNKPYSTAVKYYNETYNNENTNPTT